VRQWVDRCPIRWQSHKRLLLKSAWSFSIRPWPDRCLHLGFFTRRVSDRNPTMINTVTSKNGTTIRLTDERWAHITEEHCELAGLRMEVLETVSQPERILAGGEGEL
jgi:hypothetical protein